MGREERKLEEEIKRLEKRLQQAEENFSGLLEAGSGQFNFKDSSKGKIRLPYKIFIERMVEGAFIISKLGIILYANRSFVEMIGCTIETLLGKSILDFISKDQRPYFLEDIEAEKKEIETDLIQEEDKILTVALTVTKVIWNEFENYYILANDITSIKIGEKYNEALELVTNVLIEASPPPIAFNLVIEILDKFFGWKVLVVWTRNRPFEKLQCVEVAYVQGRDFEAFAEKTRKVSSSIMSLPEKVWAMHRPLLVENLMEEKNFERKKEAEACNLTGAVVFPYYYGDELVGVIELYRESPVTDFLDSPLHHFISSFGLAVGLYIYLKRQEATNSYYSNVVNMLNCGIYSFDSEGIIKSWSPGAERIYGWKANEILQKSIKRIYPSDKELEFNAILKKLNEGIVPERCQSKRIRKDKKEVWVDENYGVEKYQWREVGEFSVIAEDISKKKNIEEDLIFYQNTFDNFMEHTSDWIWEIDRGGVITFSNKAASKILGYPLEELIGAHIFKVLSTADLEKNQKDFLECVMLKKGWNGQVRFIQKTGEDVWVETRSSPVLDSNNELIGFRGLSRDITEDRSLEKIKKEFISTVSHELRTPLISIHGAIALLGTNKIDPKQTHKLIEIAKRNSEIVINLINNILDVEKLTYGKFTLDLKKINLGSVIQEAIDKASDLVKRYDVKIVEDKHLADVEVNGDYSRLLNVLMNLLSNALKFSRAGGLVHLSMERKGERVRVSVADCGIGVPKKFQPKLFEAFSQADSSTTRSFGGAGLGLSICKAIIEGHAGEIGYTPNDGPGSVFFFDLPIAYSDKDSHGKRA